MVAPDLRLNDEEMAKWKALEGPSTYPGSTATFSVVHLGGDSSKGLSSEVSGTTDARGLLLFTVAHLVSTLFK